MKVGKEVGIRIPPNHSWLEYKLNQQELDYVWRCIDQKKGDYKGQLAGNIDGSYLLMDRSEWFFRNTIRPLIHEYESKVGCLGNEFPLNQKFPSFALIGPRNTQEIDSSLPNLNISINNNEIKWLNLDE